jgi:hypothetical protein
VRAFVIFRSGLKIFDKLSLIGFDLMG